MKNTTLFRYNRITILTGLLICSIVPFIQLEISNELPFQAGIKTIEEFFVSNEVQVGEDKTVVIAPENPAIETVTMPENKSSFWKYSMIAVYLLGLIITALHFILSTFRLIKLIYHSEKIKHPDYTLIISDQPIASFNWGRYIALSRKDYLNHPKEIILHEYMHLRNYHTIDLLLLQLFIIIHWFNPAGWILKRELQEIHEYEADKGVINSGIDATRYQLLLVRKAAGTRLYSMVSGFNHSKLKKRITMMLKEKSKKKAQLRALLLVPMFIGVVYLFAQPAIREIAVTGNQQTPAATQTEKDNLAEYEKLVHGRVLNENERDYPILPLYVNKIDQLMLLNDFVTTTNLKDYVKELFNKERKKSLAKTGKEKAVIISLLYDRGSSYDRIREVYQIISELSDEIKKEQIKTDADKNDPDKLYPVLIYPHLPVASWQTKRVPYSGRISGVKINIQSPDKENQILENFTLQELKSKLSVTNHSLSIQIEAEPDTKMEIIKDIKDAIKDACSNCGILYQ